MGNIGRITIVGGLVGAGYLGYRYIMGLEDRFTVGIQDLGLPEFGAGSVTMPLTLGIDNRSGVHVPFDEFGMDIYVETDGQWELAGRVDDVPPMGLARGMNSIPLKVTMNGRVFAPIKGIFDGFLQKIVKGQSLYRMKFDIGMKVSGISLSYQDIRDFSVSMNLPI